MSTERLGKAVAIVVAATIATAILMLGTATVAAFLAWDMNAFSRLMEPLPQRLSVLLWLVAVFAISHVTWEGEGEE